MALRDLAAAGVVAVLALTTFTTPVQARVRTQTSGAGPATAQGQVARAWLTGVVLESWTDAPIPGVTVSWVGGDSTTQSAADGSFTLELSVGEHTLFVDGRTATAPGTYPIFAMPAKVVGGMNALSTPLWIPELDDANGVALSPANYDEATDEALQDIVIQSPSGVRVDIPAGTIVRNAFFEYAHGDILSITRIPSDKPPLPLPSGFLPTIVVMTQPGGTLFFDDDGLPKKVPIEFPDEASEYEEGASIELWSALGGSTGELVKGGTMTVTGGIIRSDPGSGISTFSCKCSVPPPPKCLPGEDNNSNRDPDESCPLPIGPRASVGLRSGDLRVWQAGPAVRQMGELLAPELAYHSPSAHPFPVVAVDCEPQTTLPTTRSLEATLPPIAPRFWSTSAAPSRHALQVQSPPANPGKLTVRLELTELYGPSTRSITSERRLLVNNQIHSPFGAGWGLRGLQRIYRDAETGEAIVVDGSGAIASFAPSVAGGHLVLFDYHDLDLYRGFGNGTFELVSTTQVGNGSFARLFVADLDGNGLDDVLLDESTKLRSVLSAGDGSFTQWVSNVNANSSLRLGDFNGDARPDVLIGSAPIGGNATVRVSLNDGQGRFLPFVDTLLPGLEYPYPITTGDLNGDGLTDLICGVDGGAGPGRLECWLSIGNGVFTRNYATTAVAPSDFPPVSGDFNGDGFADIVVSRKPQIDALIALSGNGDGTLTLGPTTVLAASGIIADFPARCNDDAYDDLLARVFGVGNDYRRPLLANGDGTFDLGDPVDLNGVQSSYAAIGDLNGDGLSDVAIQTPSQTLDNTYSFHLATDDGEYYRAGQLSHTHSGPTTVEIGGFLSGGPASFVSPAGDTSTLCVLPDGTYTRRYKNGMVVEFDSEGLQTAVVDRNGNRTSYLHNGDLTLSEIQYPTGTSAHFAYVGGKISSITNASGRTTQYSVDGAGDLVEIIYPDGAKWTMEYDSPNVDGSDHLLSTIATPRAFDSGESLPPSSFFTTIHYNFAGQVVGSERPDPDGGSPITLAITPEDSFGLIDPASGQGTGTGTPAADAPVADIEARVVDPRGFQTRATLDGFGNYLHVEDPLARTTDIERDFQGNPVRTVRPVGTIEQTFDLRRNPTSLKEAVGTSIERETVLQYEPLFSQLTLYREPLGFETSFGYDASGNPTSVTNAQGTSHGFSYDPSCPGLPSSMTVAQGQIEEATTHLSYDPSTCNTTCITNPLGFDTDVDEDADGLVSQVTDAEGHSTAFTYDAANRLTRVTDHLGRQTNFEYDANGNRTAVIDDRGGKTCFEYDSLDRLTRRVDPMGEADVFSHDRNGNVTCVTQRNGTSISYVYDAANQLVSKTLTPGGTTTYAYDDNGNLTSVVGPQSSLAFTYNELDQLTSASTAGAPLQPTVTINYAYDDNGNRVSMTDSLSGQTVYVLDDLNRVTDITPPSGATVSFTYDKLDRRTLTQFPGGASTTYTFDDASQATSVVNDSGGTVVSSFAYSYDKVGNRTGVDQVRSELTVTPSLTYLYDELNQLVQATRSVPGQPDETFVYDEVGNRLRRDGQATDAIFDAANRLLEDEGYLFTYDLSGNLETRTDRATGDVRRFIWNAEHELVSVEDLAGGQRPPTQVVQFAYDGLGRRIWKDVDGVVTRFIYDQEDILFELDGSNAVAARHTHGTGVDDVLVSAWTGGSSRIMLTDGLGSITDEVTTGGVPVRSLAFEIFGRVALDTTQGPGYSFTGREWDPAVDLHYYRARYYDPSLGRFVSEDPSGFSGGDVNLYRYVRNNPVGATDPSGLSPSDEHCRYVEDLVRRAYDDTRSGIDPNLMFPTPKDIWNIVGPFLRGAWNHIGQGPLDMKFWRPNSVFQTPVGSMGSGEFGNFMAGIAGENTGPIGDAGVRGMGKLLDLVDHLFGAQSGPFDWDADSTPAIDAGNEFARGPFCECAQ